MITAEALGRWVNLQMVAEATIPNSNEWGEALRNGNGRALKTPLPIRSILTRGYGIVGQLGNTPTGCSATLLQDLKTGELVLSIRSTEFADDYVRDTKATDSLEVNAFGFAFGQLDDLEQWIQTLTSEGTIGADLSEAAGLATPNANLNPVCLHLGRRARQAPTLISPLPLPPDRRRRRRGWRGGSRGEAS